MGDNNDSPIAYKHRGDMEKLLLVLGAGFIGVLNALAQVEEEALLRTGLAWASIFFLTAFVAFLFLHALRIFSTKDEQPKVFNILIWLAAGGGILGVLSLLLAFIAEIAQ